MATASTPMPAPASRIRYLAIGVVASVLHLLMMIPGYSEHGSFQATEWLAILVVSLGVAAALFAFVVPGGGAVTALVLGVMALASVLVFWAGVTLPIAAAGAVTALRARARGDGAALVTAALALSVVAAVALVAVIIGDATAS